MSDIFNNSIWTNGLQDAPEGHPVFYPLGTNKTEIPDGITTMWPDGDKLIGNFVYKNGKLVGFVDTEALTISGSRTTTMNYSYIDINLPSISEGKLTVNAPNATVKKITWAVNTGGDNVIVTLKYKGCKTVDDVKAVDPNYKTTDIVDGVWSEGLGDLTNGTDMFWNCSNLTLFTSDLSSLTNSYDMFMNCTNLTSFSSELPSLMNGSDMFKGCSKLTSFSSDLSSLTNGRLMFKYCSNLESFSSDLSSLMNGNSMFYQCKLDAPSIKNIIDSINAYSGELTLGIGCDNTEADKNLFAQDVGYADMSSLLAALQTKGWTVTAQYNGRPTSTYGLRSPSEDTLPVFVKLEEVEEHGNYTSEDGSKKFILDYFHETTGSTEGYTQFNSLEEAIEHFNVKPIERN